MPIKAGDKIIRPVGAGKERILVVNPGHRPAYNPGTRTGYPEHYAIRYEREPAGTPTSVEYHFHGDNPRVNINSNDYSTNTVNGSAGLSEHSAALPSGSGRNQRMLKRSVSVRAAIIVVALAIALSGVTWPIWLSFKRKWSDGDFWRGVKYERLQDVDSALDAYSSATRWNDSNRNAHFQLAMMLHRKGRYTEAATQYRRVIELDSSLVEAYINLGSVLGDAGKPEDCLSLYQQALKIAPNNAILHADLSIAWLKMGKSDEALAEARRAAQIEPTDVRTIAVKAMSLAHDMNPRESLAVWQQALKIDPTDQVAQDGFKQVQRTLYECQSLAGRAPAVLATNPNDPIIRFQTATVFQILGRRSEAIEAYNDFLRVAAKQPVKLRTAEIIEAEDRARHAIEALGSGRWYNPMKGHFELKLKQWPPQ